MTEETSATFLESLSGIARELPAAAADAGRFKEFLTHLWEVVQQYAASAGLRLVAALVVVIVGIKLTNMLTKKIRRTKVIQNTNPTAGSFMSSTLTVVLKVLVFVTAAAILGVPMTSVAALIASAGLAIGLALEGSLGNIASGFILVITKPFGVGDFISAAGYEGTVEDMGVFYTTLLSLDNTNVIVPNSVITSGTMVNLTRKKQRRVELDFPVSYRSDIDTVKRILIETALADERVLPEPAPLAVLTRHGDSSLDFKLFVRVNAPDYLSVKFALTEAVSKALVAGGVEIPYPQLDVHIKPE